ncbi:hypothetical protein [Longimicrobium sp.]|uniref:hypothetical protein n=1 Tax=Longimicrobium sp. TaxID=2029185 RepID=UPI002E3630A8|nr:hypothetical protein [Longimicrobium sp.]HEX6036705.1 hypothetical protein [Longimicrobium sp.]
MPRSLVHVLALAVLLPGTAPLHAQEPSPFDSIQTPQGRCAVWTGIPGGSSPGDWGYAPCAVDRRAMLLSDSTLPQPSLAVSLGGQYTVMVNEDGTVDPRFTRAWSISGGMDSVAYRTTLEGLRRWRFQPATRGGRAVRSGFILHVETDARVDTLPSELRWTYRPHAFGADSLVGRWHTLPAVAAPLAAEQRDSVYAAVFRRLVYMRVLAPWLEQPYCLVNGGDEEDHGRAARALRGAFQGLGRTMIDGADAGRIAGPGCERAPGVLRLFVPRLHRTEGNRVVLYPAGDYLADWPPGYGGGTYPGWTSRCVLDAAPGAAARVHCDVRPRYVARSGPRPWEREAPRWYRPGDSIQVTAVVRMRDAFQADTLRATVRDLRRLGDAAVLDPGCAVSAWNAFTAQDSGTLYVVKGDVQSRHGFDITEVRRQPPPRAPRDAGCGTDRPDALLAVFLLGELGDPVRQPVTFCTGEPLCSRRYTVDPARHTLASRPAIRFWLRDLREMTRVGDQLDLRLYVDPVPEGLMPLVVVRQEGQKPRSAWQLRRTELGAWDFAVTYDGEIPPDSEVLVYLVAR